jgi:hypothetical protein
VRSSLCEPQLATPSSTKKRRLRLDSLYSKPLPPFRRTARHHAEHADDEDHLPEHHCIHDELDHVMVPHTVQYRHSESHASSTMKSEGRRLVSGPAPASMRFHVDSTSSTAVANLPPSVRKFYVEQLMPAAAAWLGRVLYPYPLKIACTAARFPSPYSRCSVVTGAQSSSSARKPDFEGTSWRSVLWPSHS